jgi:uncharacterized protein
MVRPIKKRKVYIHPNAVYFKPRAVPLTELKEVSLERSELEALRLCDCKRMGQVASAKRMGVSQSTLQRILANARKKVASALVKGEAIKIEKEEK